MLQTIQRTTNTILPASFRDPSGFLFTRDGELLRQINRSYKDHYDLFMTSGLYDRLVKENLIIPHQEVSSEYAANEDAWKVIKPTYIDFISYPYEWCFSQLKDAALATLRIQKIALESGMSLKDASAYNIQYYAGKPVLIDTLSFEKHEEGRPWVAYRQFCQHFLAPLALMSYRDARLNRLLSLNIDGIPLDLASSLLPHRSRLNLNILLNIHAHASLQKSLSSKQVKYAEYKGFSKTKLLALLEGLESSIAGLRYKISKTEWSHYYGDTNYSEQAFAHKKEVIAEFINAIKPKTVWDLGANTGEFSKIAAKAGANVISFDVDHNVVELNYQKCVKSGEQKIVPLVVDFTNPSSGIGWANQERLPLKDRGPADLVLALALVHHLAVSNNVPFFMIAQYLSEICTCLIVEFVPKEDSQVKRLLSTRMDIFAQYTEMDFVCNFEKRFQIRKKKILKDSMRTLYLLEKRS